MNWYLACGLIIALVGAVILMLIDSLVRDALHGDRRRVQEFTRSLAPRQLTALTLLMLLGACLFVFGLAMCAGSLVP